MIYSTLRRGGHRAGVGKIRLGDPRLEEEKRIPKNHSPAKMIRAREESSLRSPSFGAAEPLPIELWILLVKHGDTCARERHQLIGYQVDEHIRHCAVERLKVNRARSPERVLTPLRGILGTCSVGKPAINLWRR